ncbi:Fpg/Nei family DNA glycosylase [Arthrobacter agilis]|uniref:Fpg/Nei family DNA glycosylase n=1 Tax=Arthrobacter agilis TaxID=37921 RepID=UPI000B34CAD0|nr:DNA-formamidopyrimidine glycosylase family protein [Arthrobacter agilis]OUM44770.1 formamidopyrimidine-DNA glycosylase [Arthrobacter agilis]PPB47094.1 Fpg/Nei family DNA glycosylase [Arthrobacter agilis]TPV22508.1 Fpg/Nei family DNA glycosylase [Arthrobacter agilis]VDR32327.1 Formamidopyrimidine-DNA glycosylase [Arthrobacter agilis]
MPEGHSVHRLAKQFTSVFSGQRLAVSSPQGRFAAGAEQLDGATLLSALAHGKQMFLRFDNDRVLRVHLGLYGAWSFGGDATFRGASSIGAPRRVGESEAPSESGPPVYAGPPAPVGAVRVRLVSDHGWADLRGPTACEVITTAEEKLARAKLGPDPLQPRSDGSAFVAKIMASITPVGIQLMNQAVIAGIGNIYRAEVLFLQGINPRRPGKLLREDEARAIWSETVRLMKDGVREGRIITTTPEARNGRPKRSAPNYVYKRTGEPCRRCGTAILSDDMAARTVYWCPSCQAD